VSVDEYGTIGVTRQEGGTPVPQYYSTYAKGSALFLDGANATSRWGNGTSTFALWDDPVTGRFTSVSHTSPDSQHIETALDAGSSGVRMNQTVSYTDGEPFYTITWVFTNLSDTGYADVRFMHGGDVSLAGEDIGTGAWSASSNMVSVNETNQPPADSMGLQGDASSPADAYYEAHFQLVRDACKAGQLPSTVDGSAHDAAYALQWSRQTLASGGSWTVTAHERWPGETITPDVFTNVTHMLQEPLFSDWQLNRQTGTLFGKLTIHNANAPGGASFIEPFWCAFDVDNDRRFMNPTGTLANDDEYLNVTVQVKAALSDDQLDPGESVTVDNIEIYMRYRTPPPDSAFSVWSTIHH